MPLAPQSPRVVKITYSVAHFLCNIRAALFPDKKHSYYTGVRSNVISIMYTNIISSN